MKFRTAKRRNPFDNRLVEALYVLVQHVLFIWAVLHAVSAAVAWPLYAWFAVGGLLMAVRLYFKLRR